MRGGRRATRKARKPTMAKAKRMVAKAKKRQVRKNQDTFFLKARVEGTIVPSQGVLTANYVYWRVNLDPTQPTFGMSHLTNAEFNLYSKMYDRYRINGAKLTITPKGNVFDSARAQQDAAFMLSGSGVVHSVLDRDGPAPSNIAALTRYPSYRKHSVLKNFSRSYSVKYPTGVWIDCQSPATFPAAKELGLTGGITVYGENFVEDNGEVFNEPWAECVVEYNIVFEGKTMGNLSFGTDPSGNVIEVCLKNHDPLNNVAFTEPKPRGTIADLRITDDQTDAPITDLGNA